MRAVHGTILGAVVYMNLFSIECTLAVLFAICVFTIMMSIVCAFIATAQGELSKFDPTSSLTNETSPTPLRKYIVCSVHDNSHMVVLSIHSTMGYSHPRELKRDTALTTMT